MQHYFDRDAIQPELPGIVLLSHGNLAIGMLDTMRLVLGNSVNVAAFTLEAGDDPLVYRQRFLEGIEAFPAGCVIFIDMFGGSPCNQFLLSAPQLSKPYCAFTGMSLPLISEANAMRELCRGEELREAVGAIAPMAALDLHQIIAELSEDSQSCD